MQNDDAAVKATSEAWLKDMKQLEEHKAWEEHSDDPCMVWKLERDGRLVTKAQTTFKLPIDPVIAYLKDALFLKKIAADQVDKAEVLHDAGDGRRVIYVKMKGFGPVSSREFVAANTFHQESPQKVYVGNKSLDFPCTIADPDAVRAEIIVGGMLIEAVDAGSTRVTAFNDVDMKGMIPDFIKNQMSKKRASNIVELEEKVRQSM